MIAISQIRLDGGTQSRVVMNQAIVDEYAELYRTGVQMDAVIVFFDKTEFWLADGFHRVAAANQAGLTEIFEDRRPGTQRDAILYSLKANAKHGLRRSNADKRKAVQTLLADAEWAAWSDVQIAKACGISDKTVAAHRRPIIGNSEDRNSEGDVKKAISANAEIEPAEAGPESHPEDAPANEPSAVRTVTRNGKTYQQNTANIGAKPAQPAKAAIVKPAAIEHITEPARSPEEADAAAMHLEMTQDAMEELRKENDSLRNQVAAMIFSGDDEEKADLLNRLNELTEANRKLEILNHGLTQARDRVMTENASLRRQCESSARKMKKAGV